MNDLDKLRVILPHWIEHNSGHGKEYDKWGQLLKSSGHEEIAELLEQAAASIKEADAALNKALKKAGGPLDEHDDHGHHHHHHHNLPE